MRTSPVSFGSLMVFRFHKPGKQVPMNDLVSLNMSECKELKERYYMDEQVKKYNEHNIDDAIDGTVWNATKNFAKELDKKYRDGKEFLKDPRRVIFTEATFVLNPNQRLEKKYFLTAATREDEDKIHKLLSQSSDFFVAKWNA